MRKSLAAAAIASLVTAGCNPSIPQTTSTPVVVAEFDPGATPPVVPVPNDLATNPMTGLLDIPVPPGASAADIDFAGYLDSLDGYPPDSPATMQFSGGLVGSSVTNSSVLVFDCGTQGCIGTFTPMAATPQYADITAGGTVVGGQINIPPPAMGWTPGHSYAVVLLGSSNTNGVKGANSLNVVGSQTWYLVRNTNSLVTGCTDANLDPTVCQPATNLIPNAGAAVQLEQLRLKYKPLLDSVATGSIQRNDIALAWSFKIGDFTTLVFEPGLSPPEVPTPNDLAINPVTGLVNAPATGSAANQEFITDYVNNLNGFPVVSTGGANAAGGILDTASVTLNAAFDGGSVLVLDVTGGGTPVAANVTFDSTTNGINIAPPAPGVWTKGHQYAAAILTNTEPGISNAVTASGGKPVIGTDIWALVRSQDPLVTGCTASPATCVQAPSASCVSTLTLASLSGSQAFQLECLRLGYEPLLNALGGLGIQRGDVGLLWTFTIDGFPEATFDPANGIIPFPNDLLTVFPLDGGSQVNLPVPASGPLRALVLGLNTLDGFSETVPAVSAQGANGPVPAIDVGNVDPTTLGSAFAADAGGAGFVDISTMSGAPVTACVSCMSSLQADGGPDPVEQIQFVPTIPLAEKNHYGAFLTTAAKNTAGQPITPSLTFALARMANSLVDAQGHSTVSGVSDADAQALEPLRAGFSPLISALGVATGIKRSQLSLVWTYATQSTVSQLQQIHALPLIYGDGGLPAAAIPSPFDDTTALEAEMTDAGLPTTGIGKIFIGETVTPFTLNGPGGTINPAAPTALPNAFILVEPSTAAPAAGYPVVVFGHGIFGSKVQMLPIASALAQGGFATIATDIVWHGDRSSCTGVAPFIGVAGATDDYACVNPATMKCNEATPIGRCVARAGPGNACNPSSFATGDLACNAAGQGACIPTGATTGNCEGGDFARDKTGTPLISGWNMLNLANFFATRDNFRQQVVDLAQLSRTIQGSLSAQIVGAGGGALDGAKINYGGISLSGILGTLYTSVAPEAHQVVLNVPAGDLVNSFLASPSFQPLVQQFIAGVAAQGIVQGTQQFDQFIGIAQWILDPADPVNYVYDVMNGAGLPADRHGLIQYIEGDQTLPNSGTDAMIAAANTTGAGTPIAVYQYVGMGKSYDPLPALGSRHGFLLDFASVPLTVDAQTQLVTFIGSGNGTVTMP